MSAQLAGILCGVFALVMAAVIYWGGFVEQERANKDFSAR
jgi:hypothetical protein